MNDNYIKQLEELIEKIVKEYFNVQRNDESDFWFTLENWENIFYITLKEWKLIFSRKKEKSLIEIVNWDCDLLLDEEIFENIILKLL